MGQKVNPISLRLKSTNKNFDSCWYSDWDYPALLTNELRVRLYIDKVFEQIRHPKPLISFSLMAKRCKILVLYLDPEQSRSQRDERLQLRSLTPSRGRVKTTPSINGLKTTPLLNGLNALPPTGLVASRARLASDAYPCAARPSKGFAIEDGWSSNWERRVLISFILLSAIQKRGGIAKLLSGKDFSLFYKAHRMVWFQARGHSNLSSRSLDQSIGLHPSMQSMSYAPQGDVHPASLQATRKPPSVPPLNPASFSIREIRRRDGNPSMCLMEAAVGVGLGASATVYPYRSRSEEQTAQFLSEEIAHYLERRVPFRRIKQVLMRELQKGCVEGMRVSCSGRVGGRSKKAQRARQEGFQWGQTSSHIFSSKLSFASRSALTPFGKVGIKVWVCYK